MKDRPKRVLVYTDPRCLPLLSQGLKGSVDGTFKSSTKLFCQNFTLMVKHLDTWLAVAHGWLPDKSEVSYKLFFILLKEELERRGLKLNLSEIISDFEIGIIKAIDDIVGCPVSGCFFHFSQCLKRKVEKSGLKGKYATNSAFQFFVKCCGGLAHMPVKDVEKGIDYLRDDQEFDFEDQELNDFKFHMITYIIKYWMDGCFPPQLWNCWTRTKDATNNNQVRTFPPYDIL